MKQYLVDTTVFIDHFRGKSSATEFLQKPDLIVPYVVVGELLQGARNKEELRLIHAFVSHYQIHWGSAHIHEKAIELLSIYYLVDGIQLLDSIIAAMALLDGFIVVTDNIKHFQKISDLSVIRIEK